MHLRLLLLLTFWLTTAVILVGRGVYFYMENVFGFGDAQRLAMAMSYGLCYVVGAMLTHRLVIRWLEKPVLIGMFIGFSVCMLIMTLAAQTAWIVVGAFVVSSFFVGGSWPIIESYISAGRGAEQTRRAVGWFNITWAAGFPVSIATVGLFLLYWPTGLFLIPALLTAMLLPMVRPLPKHPTHMAGDDPARPDAATVMRLSRQLRSARWLLLLSYALVFILAPLFPTILMENLGLSVEVATPIAASVDVARTGVFVLLYLWVGWHGHRRWLVAAALLMPVGFVIVMTGHTLPIVITGTLLFGLTHGIAYAAALNYAMVVNNASVEAGGHHEAVIGLSFALGPMVALIGVGGGSIWYGIVPLMLVCISFGLLALRMPTQINVANQ